MVQKATLFVQKKAGIPWFKFSGKAFSFWTDLKILEIFWWNFAGTNSEDDRVICRHANLNRDKVNGYHRFGWVDIIRFLYLQAPRFQSPASQIEPSLWM